MKKSVLGCAVVFTLLLASALCFGNEDRSHICFRAVDTDNDGIVTFQEFRKVFGDDQAKYDAIDLNDDGQLSHDEYHRSLGHGAS